MPGVEKGVRSIAGAELELWSFEDIEDMQVEAEALSLVVIKESDQVPLIDEELGCIVGIPGSTVVLSVPVMTGKVSPGTVLSFEGTVEGWSLAGRLVVAEVEDWPLSSNG